MITAITDSELAESAFRSLPLSDRIEVLTLGASFHRLTVVSRLEHARAKMQDLENKYGITLEQLEAMGLPEDADYVMHEDYVEWRHWRRFKAEAEAAIQVLSVFAPAVKN